MDETTGADTKPGGSVTRLLGQVQAGPSAEREAATAAIVRRYLVQLSKLVSRNLAPRLRRRIDAEDVALTTFHSFCVRLANGQFQLEGRDEFWHLLVRIALNKMRKEVAGQLTQKRDARRDQSLNNEDGASQGVLDRHTASPDDVAIMAEEMGLLLDRLPTDIRPIALWKFEGFTNHEIAAKLDCTLRTVERKVSLIREAWGRRGPDEFN